MQNIARRLARGLELLPEPFTLSMILTIVAIMASLFVGDNSVEQIAVYWSDGLWSILGFAMQMVLILSTGFALAQAPIIARGLSSICNWPKSYAQSVALVAFFSLILGSIHWGLGLAGGTLLVRQMNSLNQKRSFLGPLGLMGAAGYLPLMIWHGGLSGSAPLLVANQGHFLAKEIGVIELAQTIGHWSNLTLMASSFVLLPLVCFIWASRLSGSQSPGELAVVDAESGEEKQWSREMNWKYFGSAIGLIGLILVSVWISRTGLAKIGLNQIIGLFLFLAMLFHSRLGGFLDAFRGGVLSSWSVVLLFPFYGAIMAVVKKSGLAAEMSEALAATATAATLPIYTFFSAGLLNIFVPSGGGQWVVQGPIAISAADRLGVAHDLIVMSVAYGDQLTNMLQPFWALPLLGITKISAQELLKYTIPLMLMGATMMIATLLLRA